MNLPTTLDEFNETNSAEGFSESDLLEIVKAHSHPDYDSLEACEICSECLEIEDEVFLISMFQSWNGNPSRESLQALWVGLDNSIDTSSSWYFRFKANLGISPNAPDEYLSKVTENLFCEYSNDGDQDHDYPFVMDFERMKKSPRCTEEVLEDFRVRMHDGYFWNECNCPNPDTCPLCIGHHNKE